MGTLNILSNSDASHSLERKDSGHLRSTVNAMKPRTLGSPHPCCLWRTGEGFAEEVPATLGPADLVLWGYIKQNALLFYLHLF